MREPVPLHELTFRRVSDRPLNLGIHPQAERYQYYLQVIALDEGRFLGIIGARNYPPPRGDDRRRIFVAESTDLIHWTNGRVIWSHRESPILITITMSLTPSR